MKMTERKVKKCPMCKILKSLSIETWERIGFARTRKGLKIYETTITQNILYTLKKYSEASSIVNIEMYEAVNEKINGNDIEICIETKTGYILLPTQAKILYKTGKYDKINHANQIKKLIEYADKIEGIPLHVFYNFDKIDARKEFGCTIIETKKLLSDFKKIGEKYKVRVPSFLDLHNSSSAKAKPWHEFLCSVHVNKDTKFYTKNDVVKKSEWKKFDLSQEVIFLKNKEDLNYDIGCYLPGYRIIVKMEEQQKSNQ